MIKNPVYLKAIEIILTRSGYIAEYYSYNRSVSLSGGTGIITHKQGFRVCLKKIKYIK